MDPRTNPSGEVPVGTRIGQSATFEASEVSRFARLAGDDNPIHHDLSAARAAGFESLVVGGPQLSSRLMGLTATHFSVGPGASAGRRMLGLDFRFRFRKAVYAAQPLFFHWQVVAVRPKASLGGQLVFLAGGVRDDAGRDAVKSVGKVLVR